MNCPVSVNYGLSERTNIAFSRVSDDGNSLVYDIDPIYGQTERNQVGQNQHELLGTSYWNHTMPLIRYCTQDLAEVSGNTITHLDGRVQEVLIGRMGEEVPGFSIKIDPYTWEYIDTYQVVQSKKGELLIQIVPKKTLPHGFMQRLASSQEARLGDMFTIEFVVVKQVSKSARAKQQLIISTLR
jgi:phenylacetate-CoA ligase